MPRIKNVPITDEHVKSALKGLADVHETAQSVLTKAAELMRASQRTDAGLAWAVADACRALQVPELFPLFGTVMRAYFETSSLVTYSYGRPKPDLVADIIEFAAWLDANRS